MSYIIEWKPFLGATPPPPLYRSDLKTAIVLADGLLITYGFVQNSARLVHLGKRSYA
jgi:hypothetical protein